ADHADERTLTLARANLAAIAVDLGRPDEAEPVLLEALAADRKSGSRFGEAQDWRFLGLASLASGQLEPARERLERALELAREHEDPIGEGESRLGLSVRALDAGDPAAARQQAEAGLRALA